MKKRLEGTHTSVDFEVECPNEKKDVPIKA